jgi:hypothetical protein
MNIKYKDVNGIFDIMEKRENDSKSQKYLKNNTDLLDSLLFFFLL